ncbi:LamG domain-containing protein [Mucilaginibacter roseus]|uniref:LamG domain-containing protein n=1 Tax=Mucilaginibacter roseus TaxID=1528868 RepID=A0ABS8U4R1_9SPHI|nr:LamG domain-containing protein [Mucilaginibacter roseus]MCD8740864.1 LamG domain-containing protein [Mucilaginibacter roseus]
MTTKTRVARTLLLAGTLISSFIVSCKKSDLLKSEDIKAIVDNELRTANIAVPATGLIAYWSFDGTGNDLSGNANHGTINNLSSTADRFGNPIGAYYFDGSTSYISVPDKAALRLNNTDFTLNAWVKLDSYNTSAGSQIFSKRITGANNGWVWSIVGSGAASPAIPGTVSYGPGGGSTNAFGTTAVPVSQWHMITSVYSFSAQQLRIYVDGVLDNTTNGVASPNSAITAMLYIGRDNPSIGTGYFYKGALDDMSIYNSALSASTITTLYKSTSNNAAPGLVAYWPFDNSGNDMSGNWNNGTINNLSAATDRFGNSIGAYFFNGVDGYMSVPDNTTLRLSNTDFTLNAWVKLSSYNSSLGSVIFSKRLTGANNGWQWSIVGSGAAPNTQGVLSYGPGGGSVNAYGTTVIPLNEWHMVTSVYTVSNQQLRIYVDGALKNTVSGIATTNANIAALLYVGRDNPSLSTNYNFHGALDGLSIYNSALSASNILQLYTATN